MPAWRRARRSLAPRASRMSPATRRAGTPDISARLCAEQPDVAAGERPDQQSDGQVLVDAQPVPRVRRVRAPSNRRRWRRTPARVRRGRCARRVGDRAMRPGGEGGDSPRSSPRRWPHVGSAAGRAARRAAPELRRHCSKRSNSRQSAAARVAASTIADQRQHGRALADFGERGGDRSGSTVRGARSPFARSRRRWPRNPRDRRRRATGKRERRARDLGDVAGERQHDVPRRVASAREGLGQRAADARLGIVERRVSAISAWRALPARVAMKIGARQRVHRVGARVRPTPAAASSGSDARGQLHRKGQGILRRRGRSQGLPEKNATALPFPAITVNDGLNSAAAGVKK